MLLEDAIENVDPETNREAPSRAKIYLHAQCATMAVIVNLAAKFAFAEQPRPTEGLVGYSSIRFALPPAILPVSVVASFALQGVNKVNEETESFQFSGVLSQEWLDPRQMFDSAEAGDGEKLFQGRFQLEELASLWCPQIVLANASEPLAISTVLLRIQPDGRCKLLQWINATAESKLDLRSSTFTARPSTTKN